jgi:two-component system, LytTR family, sensor kinase
MMQSTAISLPLLPFRIKWRQVLVIVTHIFFWACFIFLPFILIQSQNIVSDPQTQLTQAQKDQIFQQTFYFSQFLSVILFYTNTEILLPKIFKRYGVGVYSLVIISALILCLILAYMFRMWALGFQPRTLFTYSTFYSLVSVVGISTCFRILSDYQREQRLQTEKERARLQSELSFLRSQISPHFMFNLMNSLASLARKKSDLVEPMIVKMSDLLRYMLYESDDTKIPLDREINYLKSYVELQQMRFGNKVKVNVAVETPTNGLALEPMLLIPFVENAFKHGTGLIREPQIDIGLTSEGYKLKFRVQNKFNADFQEAKDSSSGIGLTNVKRRLELLYPEQHSLVISKQDNLFVADLEINLRQR